MFFFFLLTSVGGEVMLERLGKTPVVPPLAPGHEEPRNVFAQIPKLEDPGDEHSCERHGRYSWSVFSKIKSSLQVFSHGAFPWR